MTGPSKKRRRQKPAHRDVKLEELQSILARAKTTVLSEDDHQTLASAVDTLALLTRELEAKGASIRRLRRMLFGITTEKTNKVLGATDGSASSETDLKGPAGKPPRRKSKGHGRNPAEAYRGARKVVVPLEELSAKDPCPKCSRGKLYEQKNPALLVRIIGMAPLNATTYELARLRCNLCGTVFTASPPPGVGRVRYDETAASMIALLKYGCGFPFNRLERLQKDLGIPLPAATQWDVVSRAASLLEGAHRELIRQAAQGEVLHNDDTTMKILDLPERPTENGSRERRGVYTSGIVSIAGERQIAVFFTGLQHAGENLSDVIAHRAEELAVPIQMCDALSHNTAGDFKTIVANCLAHGRRKFTDVAVDFPEECRFVLETLREVYGHDAAARKEGMSPEERLRLHQARSKPLMDKLEHWMREQFKQRLVEPNSVLGSAIGYMQKHWSKLTLFLTEPGAPLDNNICERALKKAILHRKNALFYRSLRGANVGDLFMSLIHTAELCGEDPFEYLVALQRHQTQVNETPDAWMPWNFREALAGTDGLAERSCDAGLPA